MRIESEEYFKLINSPCSASLGDNIWLVIKNGDLFVVLDTPDGYFKYYISTPGELAEILRDFI